MTKLETRELYCKINCEERLDFVIKNIEIGEANYPGQTSGDITFSRMYDYISKVCEECEMLNIEELQNKNCMEEMVIACKDIEKIKREFLFFGIYVVPRLHLLTNSEEIIARNTLEEIKKCITISFYDILSLYIGEKRERTQILFSNKLLEEIELYDFFLTIEKDFCYKALYELLGSNLDSENKKCDSPLIGNKSKVYYEKALSDERELYEKANQLRLCLEKTIESIVYPVLLTNDDKKKYYQYKKSGEAKVDEKGRQKSINLYNKIELIEPYLETDFKVKLDKLRVLGNEGTHEGLDAELCQEDIDELLVILKEFSINIFVALFKKNQFYESNSWTLTVFSVLPPRYRVFILEKYFKYDQSPMVIEKLALAYLKNREIKKAYTFIKESFDREYIDFYMYNVLFGKLNILRPELDNLGSAKNLNDSKEMLKRILNSMDFEQINFCTSMLSIICEIDIFNDNKILKNSNEYKEFNMALKIHGKNVNQKTDDKKIVINERMARDLEVQELDILSDELGNLYKISYVEDSFLMPYFSETGDIIDGCISPFFIEKNIEQFKEVPEFKIDLSDGSTGIKYENKITVLKMRFRKNS